MARDVTILSMNCRGLADVEKRNDVLLYLKKKNYSIYCLQETHFSEKIHSVITSKWGYKAYLNSSTLTKKKKKKRLAILINNNFEFTFVNLVTDDKGDFMLLLLLGLQSMNNIYNFVLPPPSLSPTLQHFSCLLPPPPPPPLHFFSCQRVHTDPALPRPLGLCHENTAFRATTQPSKRVHSLRPCLPD